MFTIALSILAMFMWWFGTGPFLLFFNAVAHSETNLDLHYAKERGKSTFGLRIKQVLHCVGYLVWVVGLIAIPVLFKIYMK